LLWTLRVLVATDTREIAGFAGIVAAVCATPALAFGIAAGSPRVGSLLGAPTAVLLAIKPYVAPLSYRDYQGVRSTFSPAAETHLYYLVPGFLLGVVGIGLAFVPASGGDPRAREELRFFFRMTGGVLGLVAAAGLLLLFTNSRGSADHVVFGLVPSALVGIASFASLVRGRVDDDAPPSARARPYREAAAPSPSVSMPAGETTDALLRALAHAPAPGVHALPAALLALPAGARIGAFVVRESLGSGGMGVVYRARDERLGREVALKLLPPHLAVDPTRRARFLREARAAASVVHPNVAAVFELGESDQPFIAMELVVGRTLRAALAAGALPRSEVYRIARAIAAGLSEAHARGLVHRDLKPENVMISNEGTPKIVDFGLARAAGSALDPAGVTAVQATLTQSGFIVGTPRYMAPEQATGGEVDARADVYAFGVLLAEMATGALLDPQAPAFRRAELASAAVARTAPELAPIVARCLAFDPSSRFADAGEIASALDGAVAHVGAA
jgi:hypothetical protein